MKKLLVIGIVALFVGLAFIPSLNAVSISNNIEETNNVPPKIEIVEIVPFPYYLYDPHIGDLYIGARIKYIGDQTYEGHFGYHAEAYNMRTGELYTTYTQNAYGIIYPGEEYFPTNFLVRFTPIPYGISKQETYRIWGGWTGAPPHCKKVNSKDLSLSPRTIDFLKLEDIPKVSDTVEDCDCNIPNGKLHLAEKLLNRLEKNEILSNVNDLSITPSVLPICGLLGDICSHYAELADKYLRLAYDNPYESLKFLIYFSLCMTYGAIAINILYIGWFLGCWGR